MTPSSSALPVGNRVAMISGASRGIGAALARRLLAEGYRASLGVRRPETVPADILAYGPERVLVSRFDALEPASARHWLDATVAQFGGVDILINNAGILRQLDFTDGGEEAFDELFGVNVKAPFRLIRLALPSLARCGHGRIINIVSTDGKRYRDSVSIGYAATKHAMLAISHAARFAGWEAGVRVTAICPGAVDTELVANVPGVVPPASRLDPATLGDLVVTVLALPNTASVPEIVVNTRLESTI
jgi:NAD(P)-dependent dehydrogenase (short-subunit alcohol dehydrogenase family)